MLQSRWREVGERGEGGVILEALLLVLLLMLMVLLLLVMLTYGYWYALFCCCFVANGVSDAIVVGSVTAL